MWDYLSSFKPRSIDLLLPLATYDNLPPADWYSARSHRQRRACLRGAHARRPLLSAASTKSASRAGARDPSGTSSGASEASAVASLKPVISDSRDLGGVTGVLVQEDQLVIGDHRRGL